MLKKERILDFLLGWGKRRLVRKLVKLVSKGNPYALAAVEVYGLYEILQSWQDRK